MKLNLPRHDFHSVEQRTEIGCCPKALKRGETSTEEANGSEHLKHEKVRLLISKFNKALVLLQHYR